MDISIIGPIALTAAIVISAPAHSEEQDFGEKTYEKYCSTCHGHEATGGGDLTQVLTVDVPDLTQLSARNDGEFPMLRVIHVIDGRTGMRGHGGTMPVYGALFDDEYESAGPFGAPVYTRGRILSLAYYLESLQGK